MLNSIIIFLTLFCAIIGAAVVAYNLADRTETGFRIKSFITKWNELLTIPMAFGLWVFSGPILRFFDETAATFDAGIFQAYLLAIIGLLIFHGFVRILMKLMWPRLDKFLDIQFTVHFNTLTSWQKIKLSCSVFFLLLFALVLLAQLAA